LLFEGPFIALATVSEAEASKTQAVKAKQIEDTSPVFH
jgi:hypothetical protein